MDFHVFLAGTGGVKIGKRIFEKLGSDWVLQSSRQGYPEQNFALYHLGMVPGQKVSKGVRQGWIFVFFFGRYWGVKSDKIGRVFLQKLGSDLVVQSSR